MALTFNGNNYITKASAVVASAPMTLACWVNLSSVGTPNMNVMAITSSGAGHSSFYAISFDGTAHKFFCNILADSGSPSDVAAASSLVISASTWYHVACVFTSTTSRTCYVNGGNSVSSAVSVAPGTCNGTYVGGSFWNNAVHVPTRGTIAFPSIYNVALTAADVLALSKQIGPLHYRTSALKSYLRLIGSSPEPDLMGGSYTLVPG